MVNGTYILEWRLVITVACGTRYEIVITKRHLKVIPSTFGAIFKRKNSINGQTELILQWRLNYSKYGIYTGLFRCENGYN